MKKISVLYILYDGLTEPLGQSQVLPYLQGLCSMGYKFTILSCEKTERFKGGESGVRKMIKGYDISWHPLRYRKNPPVLSTLMDVMNLKIRAEELCRENEFQIVHCRSYIPAIVGSAISKKFGIKFLFDMRGFFADERVDGKIWDLYNPVYSRIYNYFKKKERQWLGEADHVISLTYKAVEHIMRLAPQARVTVIPCCVKTENFNYKDYPPDIQQKVRADLGLGKHESVLLYHGSIGTWYMMDEMLEFFKLFHEMVPGSKFVFLSKEPVDHIKSAAQKIGIDPDTIIVKSVPFAEVPLHLSIAEASVFFIKPVFSKSASSPTKLAELFSMGIAVFTNSGVGDVDEIISKGDSSYLLAEFNKEAFRRSIESYLNSGPVDKNGLREIAVNEFDTAVGVERYAEVYRQMLHGKEAAQKAGVS